MNFDLVIRGGRVVDPSQDIDRVTEVGFAGGRVIAVGDGLAGNARTVEDAGGLIVTPGLVDLHTHVYWGGTSLGVDPLILAERGCTTLADTGSAGPGNYPGFLEHVIRPSPVRILAYLNVSFAGIYGFSKRIMVGESGDLRLMAPIDAVEVAEANRDTIVGIKVRVGFNASGNSGLVPLDIARQVAERADLPMMVHIDVPPPTLPDVLARMRPGDILTHCFRPFPNTPVTFDGRVHPAVAEARSAESSSTSATAWGRSRSTPHARCSQRGSCRTASRAMCMRSVSMVRRSTCSPRCPNSSASAFHLPRSFGRRRSIPPTRSSALISERSSPAASATPPCWRSRKVRSTTSILPAPSLSDARA